MTDLIFSMKKNDTTKPLKLALKYDTGTTTNAIDLTGCTVNLYMRKRDSRDLKVDGSACTITSATSGYCQYDWVATDTGTAGVYDAEVLVTTTSTGTRETFPDGTDNIVVIISERL